MSWRTVVVTQHAKISYSGRRIIVQTNETIHQIPIDDIQVLLISTLQAVITAPAITELSQAGAKIIFTGRNSNPACEVTELYPGNRNAISITRQAQWSDKLKETLWDAIVRAKINMQLQSAAQLGHEITELQAESAQCQFADKTNKEAVIARKYFQLVFGKDFVRTDFNPVNAALNYGYSILLAAINREIVCNGFLTQLGVHHHNAMSDFNLGSDLMEPFRPIIDYWVATQKFNELTPDVKFGLIELLNLEIEYNGKNTLLRNALTKHVQNCLNYTTKPEGNLSIKVALIHEVPHHAFISHV